MIKYGSKVIVRDGTQLEGEEGLVIKVLNDLDAEVLLDKQIIWPVKLERLILTA